MLEQKIDKNLLSWTKFFSTKQKLRLVIDRYKNWEKQIKIEI